MPEWAFIIVNYSMVSFADLSDVNMASIVQKFYPGRRFVSLSVPTYQLRLTFSSNKSALGIVPATRKKNVFKTHHVLISFKNEKEILRKIQVKREALK